jgi:hypothetical protein
VLEPSSAPTTPPPKPTRRRIMPTLGSRLEDLLMQKYRSMRYADAKNLVADCRQTLKMSRIEPWTDQLLDECERRWKSTMEIADTDEVALLMVVATTISGESAAERTKEPVEEKEVLVVEDLQCLPEKLYCHQQPIVDGSSTTEPVEDSDGSSFEEAKEIKQPVVEESTGVLVVQEEPPKVAEINNAVVMEDDRNQAAAGNKQDEADDDNEDDDNDDDDDDDDEDENHSQESDHSQCFTTAEEAGISKAAIAAAIAEAEKAEADDLAFVARYELPPEQHTKKTKKVVAATTTAIAPTVPAVTTSHHHHRPTTKTTTMEKTKKQFIIEDHGTIDTAENSELGGIPAVIFVRKDGKCEVPEDEPLGESYNIPLPLLLATAKKSRVRKLRANFARRLQRWGLVRGSRDPKLAPRLQENDPEAHFQTLVDL